MCLMEEYYCVMVLLVMLLEELRLASLQLRMPAGREWSRFNAPCHHQRNITRGAIGDSIIKERELNAPLKCSDGCLQQSW